MQKLVDKNILGMYASYFVIPISDTFFQQTGPDGGRKRAASNLKPIYAY